MATSVYGAMPGPLFYWNGWAASACMHTVAVGAALFLSHQLPTPQQAERDPIAVAFVTPQPTHTAPTHRQTMKKAPPTPTVKPKQVQPEVIPREPTQSKPHTQTQPRQTQPRQTQPRQTQPKQKISPQTVVHASPQPAPLPTLHVTNATPISVTQPLSHTPAAQPTTPPQRASQPAVSSGMIASQPMPQHTDVARQHAAPAVHAHRKPVHVDKKPVHVEAKTNKVDPVTPRDRVIRNHVTHVPRPAATPVRSATLRHSVTSARHVFPKRASKQAALSSGSPVAQTRTTVSYTRQTRKARPATTSRSASSGGLSPELLAFSKLLREKIARTLTFPRLAKRLGYSGTTHVAIALSKTGIVRDLTVSQPSGYEILDKAAIATLEKVLQTTKPPKSIEIEQLVIPIAFNLKRN